MEVTKRNVLLECLGWMERIKKAYSKNEEGREPEEKYREAFIEYEKKCEVLRELIRALESEPVRDAMANWQELMKKYGPLEYADKLILRDIKDDNKKDFPIMPEGQK